MVKKKDSLFDAYEGIINAFESPGEKFDEIGDVDKSDLDRNFSAPNEKAEKKAHRDGADTNPLTEGWDDIISDNDLMKLIEEEQDGLKARKHTEAFKDSDLLDTIKKLNGDYDISGDLVGIANVNDDRDGANSSVPDLEISEDSEDVRTGYIPEPNHDFGDHNVITEADVIAIQDKKSDEEIEAEIKRELEPELETGFVKEDFIELADGIYLDTDTEEQKALSRQQNPNVDREEFMHKIGTGDPFNVQRADTLTETEKKNEINNDLEELGEYIPPSPEQMKAYFEKKKDEDGEVGELDEDKPESKKAAKLLDELEKIGDETLATEISDAEMEHVTDWIHGADDPQEDMRGVMQCELCGKTFEPYESEDSMYRHLKISHPNDIESPTTFADNFESKASEYDTVKAQKAATHFGMDLQTVIDAGNVEEMINDYDQEVDGYMIESAKEYDVKVEGEDDSPSEGSMGDIWTCPDCGFKSASKDEYNDHQIAHRDDIVEGDQVPATVGTPLDDSSISKESQDFQVLSKYYD